MKLESLKNGKFEKFTISNEIMMMVNGGQTFSTQERGVACDTDTKSRTGEKQLYDSDIRDCDGNSTHHEFTKPEEGFIADDYDFH